MFACTVARKNKLDKWLWRRRTAMSVDRIWSLTRQPFILSYTPRVQHQCKWEIFMAERTGCTVCGVIHVYDQLTFQHQIITDDSICLVRIL